MLAVSIPAWWAIILTSEQARLYFFAPEFGESRFAIFLFADLLLVTLGSVTVCLAVMRKASVACHAATWFVTGAMCYAAVCTITLWTSGDCTLLAMTTMSVGAIACVAVSWLTLEVAK